MSTEEKTINSIVQHKKPFICNLLQKNIELAQKKIYNYQKFTCRARQKLKGKNMKKAVCFFTAIAIICTASLHAFAYDDAYISNSEIWLDSAVNTSEIEDTRIEGIFQFFINGKTLYCHISHNVNISEEDTVLIGTTINNTSAFEFGEDELKNEFIKTGLHFENNKNEIYFAVDFKDRELCKSKNSIKITIRINDITYLIYRDIEADFSEAEKTTAKKETTKKAAETTVKNKTTKEKTVKEAVTKFRYSGNAKTDKSSESQVTKASKIEPSNSETVITESNFNDSETELSAASKALLLVSGFLILSGFIILLSAAEKHKKDRDNNS